MFLCLDFNLFLRVDLHNHGSPTQWYSNFHVNLGGERTVLNLFAVSQLLRTAN